MALKRLSIPSQLAYPVRVVEGHVRPGAFLEEGAPIFTLETADGKRGIMRAPIAGKVVEGPALEGTSFAEPSPAIGIETDPAPEAFDATVSDVAPPPMPSPAPESAPASAPTEAAPTPPLPAGERHAGFIVGLVSLLLALALGAAIGFGAATGASAVDNGREFDPDAIWIVLGTVAAVAAFILAGTLAGALRVRQRATFVTSVLATALCLVVYVDRGPAEGVVADRILAAIPAGTLPFLATGDERLVTRVMGNTGVRVPLPATFQIDEGYLNSDTRAIFEARYHVDGDLPTVGVRIREISPKADMATEARTLPTTDKLIPPDDVIGSGPDWFERVARNPMLWWLDHTRAMRMTACDGRTILVELDVAYALGEEERMATSTRDWARAITGGNC